MYPTQLKNVLLTKKQTRFSIPRTKWRPYDLHTLEEVTFKTAAPRIPLLVEVIAG